jgi:hypothetical protein
VKTIKRNTNWTQKDTDYLINSDLPLAKIAKKLNRTTPACTMRRYNTKQKIAKGQPLYGRAGRPRKTTIALVDPAFYIAKAIAPVAPIYQYEGKHSIATLNKLGWLTRTLLGVKAA